MPKHFGTRTAGKLQTKLTNCHHLKQKKKSIHFMQQPSQPPLSAFCQALQQCFLKKLPLFDPSFSTDIDGVLTHNQVQAVLDKPFTKQDTTQWNTIIQHFKPVIVLFENKTPAELVQYAVQHAETVALFAANSFWCSPVLAVLIEVEPPRLVIRFALPYCFWVWAKAHVECESGVRNGELTVK